MGTTSVVRCFCVRKKLIFILLCPVFWLVEPKKKKIEKKRFGVVDELNCRSETQISPSPHINKCFPHKTTKMTTNAARQAVQRLQNLGSGADGSTSFFVL